ncbi:hypothetical protein AMTRI_Chr03g144340 [Amborella trichopoda]|uniref:Major facilitator superfamily (MFS) profile domain-containing protein n=1 Tax=Amborella trichopoda TaxID=13333 RepID=W1NG92_AMBTC|nr:probable folate-biopterin transporter 7 [Amborella trichopoda]ERM94812.1 hypothetical protein AMTR_s00011p00267400 [Amborella trichopoda]|eukprot:XP_006878667.1 probable folate-biopterin transporter 7 [Amborella trichopoda]
MVSENGKPLIPLLGLGFFVQGFRCFPWLAINFFLKDTLGVAPSTLQLLQNSANLPMVGKPIYGLVSDAVYIRGEHRLPYIAIGGFLQAVSWLSIALLPDSSISILTLSLLLLLSNLGASIAEVANDALVAVAGKQPEHARKHLKPARKQPSGELQSFVWMAGSAGGVIGNLLGGLFLSYFSPKLMFLLFGLLLSLQLLTTLTISEASLNLPKNPKTGIRNQFSNLMGALEKPEIALSVAWFSASFALVPILTGSMFFYQTHYLKVDPSTVGLSKVVGQMAILIGSMIYNRRLKSLSPRKLIVSVQLLIAACMFSDWLFVKRVYNQIGICDGVYVVLFSGLFEALFQFKVLPFSVLLAQLCPPGCEGSLMAFVMSSLAMATIVGGYLGVGLASWVGISENDFGGLPQGILIQALCTVVPVFWSHWISEPSRKED